MAFSSPRGILDLVPESLRSVLVRLAGGRRKTATLGVAALALAVGYHVVFGANGLFVYGNKRQESKVLERQMLELTRENEALHSHVERLQSDPGAIEHQAREQLHY